ncbi:flp pilus-assembly TadE/G-like family protein [Microbispora sp. NPDC049125]|uniref:flp pilus-assembly TadE/G-like family protein n=1 Tax=Microbispora sp. NPDC049125 TaxID=3154929 RepID=UPI0034662B70
MPRDRERGSLSVFMVGFAFLGLGLAGILVDLSSMTNSYLRAADIAEQAARAGAGDIDEDYLLRTGNVRIADTGSSCGKARAIVAAHRDDQVALLGCRVPDDQHVVVTVRLPWDAYFLAAFGVRGGTRDATATAGPKTGQGG